MRVLVTAFVRAGQRGAAAVEMAMLLPLLVMLGFGVIEFGLAWGQDIALGNGAREAARLAAVHADCDEIVAVGSGAAETLNGGSYGSAHTLPRLGIDPSQVTVTVDGGACPSGDIPCHGNTGTLVTVEARYQRELFVPFVPASAAAFDIAGQGVFRCE